MRAADEVAPDPPVLTEAAALTTATGSPTAAPGNEASIHAATGDAAIAEAENGDDMLVAQQTDGETAERINYAFGAGGTIGLSDDGETALGEGGGRSWVAFRLPILSQCIRHRSLVTTHYLPQR